MPLQRFWLLLNTISRITSEEQLSKLSVARVAGSEEKSYKAYCQKLTMTMGDLVKYSEPWFVSDAEALAGIERLRQLCKSGQNRGFSKRQVKERA